MRELVRTRAARRTHSAYLWDVFDGVVFRSKLGREVEELFECVREPLMDKAQRIDRISDGRSHSCATK